MHKNISIKGNSSLMPSFNRRRIQDLAGRIGGGMSAYYAAKRNQRFNRLNNMAGSDMSRRQTDVRPITQQKDAALMYRKKKMPRRRRRQWKRFVKKVQASTDKEYARQSVLSNSTIAVSQLVNTQAYGVSAVYTPDGGGSGNADLAGILANSQAAAAPSGTWDDYYLKFCSATCDVFIKNTNASEVLRVELHYFTTRRDLTSNVSVNVATAFNDFAQQTPIITAGYTACTGNTPGIEPFDVSKWCSFFAVYKKEEVIIQPGQTITVQIRDAKNRFIKGETVQGKCALRGVTRGILWTMGTMWNGTERPAFTASVEQQKHYSYIQKEKNIQALGLI